MTHTTLRGCIWALVLGYSACGGDPSETVATTATEGGAAAPHLEPSAREPDLIDAPEAPLPAPVERERDVNDVPSPVSDDPSICAAPDGVVASPHSIEEAVALMNALPKPTSVACLLQSLERPLEIYATRSQLSAQPAGGERSPRTFIVLGSLRVSIVPGGASRDLVELGYQTSDARSIKAEIAFPLTRPLSAADLIQRIQTGRVSMCSGCHIDERRVTDGIFAGTEGGFESGVIPPLFVQEVDIESYRAEATSCDAALEPERCSMLDALFGHGEVRASRLWSGADLEP